MQQRYLINPDHVALLEGTSDQERRYDLGEDEQLRCQGVVHFGPASVFVRIDEDGSVVSHRVVTEKVL